MALAANGLLMVAEVVGGLAFHSLALLADASHLVSDVIGLGIALVAQRLLVRPATARHSYGLQRAEVVGGQLNGLVLVVAAAWITYEAIGRFGSPADVRGGGVLVIATIGLAVNLVSAVMLSRAKGESLNMRGAYVHMALDAVGSVGAILAAIAILTVHADWADPAVSIGMAMLIVWGAWGLLRDTTHVMLEGTPKGVDQASVEAALLADDQVAAVHHTHLWSLASDVTAFSGHVVLGEDRSLHDAQADADRLKTMLRQRFGIDHATLELECHPCADDGPRGDTGAADGGHGHPTSPATEHT
jgi:cobalt-zinc-cadmium efflux system protein